MDDQGSPVSNWNPVVVIFVTHREPQRTPGWSRKIRMIKLSNLNIKGVLLSLYSFNHKEPQNPRSSSSFLSQFWQSLGTDLLVFTPATGHTNIIFFSSLQFFMLLVLGMVFIQLVNMYFNIHEFIGKSDYCSRYDFHAIYVLVLGTIRQGLLRGP